MNFRTTLTYLQRIIISLLFLIHLFCEIQACEEPGIYQDLTKALQNPLDVLALNLSEQKLKALPKKIGQLKNLQELNLDANQLTTIPKEIEQLKNLQVLNFGSNQITTLSQEIGQLQNLKVLFLNNNQLTTLPKEIGQLKNLQ
uniref:leucine-rich repeat domain-containing protein n=1 Tax=Leptospira interrogans TaxID=173 RepID=UPI0002BC1D65